MVRHRIMLFFIALAALAATSCVSGKIPVNFEKQMLTKQEYTQIINDLIEQRDNERSIFGASILVMLVAFALYVGSNKKRNRLHIEKANKQMKNDIKDKMELLEIQKEQLQITNNRISESITYAERIQHSILPAPELLNSYPIEESFIFYSPLDIVSGDFYWFTRMGDKLLLCCADCTGHGVPGGFMSMIASTILSDICAKANDTILPSEILEQLDERVRINLAQNTDTESAAAKDGLDIAIASIDLKTKAVTISAARRPVILVRDQEILTIKGVKRSIGDTEPQLQNRAFENTTTQLHAGDVVYMFSDGYTDQIGGEQSEKMKMQRVLSMLRGIHNDEMDEQCLTVQEYFTQWKGDHPQIDDVLFMGVKL